METQSHVLPAGAAWRFIPFLQQRYEENNEEEVAVQTACVLPCFIVLLPGCSLMQVEGISIFWNEAIQ